MSDKVSHISLKMCSWLTWTHMHTQLTKQPIIFEQLGIGEMQYEGQSRFYHTCMCVTYHLSPGFHRTFNTVDILLTHFCPLSSPHTKVRLFFNLLSMFGVLSQPLTWNMPPLKVACYVCCIFCSVSETTPTCDTGSTKLQLRNWPIGPQRWLPFDQDR